MRLSRSPAYMVARPKNCLAGCAHRRCKDHAANCVALRQAPIVEEEYRGRSSSPPTLPTIVASLIGQNVLGRKPQLGKPNRTTGPSRPATNTSPEFLTLVDDPR